MSEKIHVTVDTSQVDKELRRLQEAPDMKTVVAFNALFAEVTAEVMAIIHVETGSLKTTARWEVDPFPTGWQGTVHVGGAAPGEINDPAYYGVFELARGGSHFFFAPAYAEIPSKMTDIIMDFFNGGDAGTAEQASTPTPGIGGAASTIVKSAEGTVRHEAKNAEKKVKKRVEKDLKRDVEKSDEDLFREDMERNSRLFNISTSGTGGEGLKRRSASTKAAQEDVESRDRTAEARKLYGIEEPTKLKPHRITRARRRNF
jgi:hypothetical protein